MTYRLITPQSQINEFLTYFPGTLLYAHETSCHLVTLMDEAGNVIAISAIYI